MTTLDELTLHARQTLAAHDADLATLATRAEHTGQHQAYDEARADANEIRLFAVGGEGERRVAGVERPVVLL